MDKDIDYEFQRLRERLEQKIQQLDDELRRAINRKADKDHSHQQYQTNNLEQGEDR